MVNNSNMYLFPFSPCTFYFHLALPKFKVYKVIIILCNALVTCEITHSLTHMFKTSIVSVLGQYIHLCIVGVSYFCLSKSIVIKTTKIKVEKNFNATLRSLRCDFFSFLSIFGRSRENSIKIMIILTLLAEDETDHDDIFMR